MNITPINAVSFKGEWEIKEAQVNRSKIGHWCFNRFHIYHPYPNEPEIDIAIKLEQMAQKYSGKRRITKTPVGEVINFHYINFVKLGKPSIAKKEAAELTKKQARLQALQAEAKGLLKIINAELRKVGKKLALIPKTKRMRPRRLM